MPVDRAGPPRLSNRRVQPSVQAHVRRVAALAVVLPLIAGGCTFAPASANLPHEAAPDPTCPASPMGALSNTAPDHGSGSGPVYLSGQSAWYSGGQVAIIMVDPSYAGPLHVRAARLGGSGTSSVTLAEENLSPDSLAGLVAKERAHSVVLVPATHTSDGGLELQAVEPSSLWRGWFGRLSTSGQGCFELQVDGPALSEVIVFSVHGGSPPPG